MQTRNNENNNNENRKSEIYLVRSMYYTSDNMKFCDLYSAQKRLLFCFIFRSNDVHAIYLFCSDLSVCLFENI